MHQKRIVYAGKKVNETDKALIMLHGRGASAQDILSLSPYLEVKDFALLAPQASNNTWYPLPFLAPPNQNEPWLTSALYLIGEIVHDLKLQGIRDDHIYFLGFSQGACLTLEFTARNARKWGGVVAFTGGLIGDKIYPENYNGDFDQTPIFIGTSDPDPHIPLDRVHASAKIINEMNGMVRTEVYKNMGHTINQDEFDKVNEFVFKTMVLK